MFPSISEIMSHMTPGWMMGVGFALLVLANKNRVVNKLRESDLFINIFMAVFFASLVGILWY